MTDKNKAIIYTAIAIISWSTVASAFKIGLRYCSFFELILISSNVALFAYTLIITFQKKWKLLKELQPRDWMRYAFTGMLNPVIYYLILFKSYELLPAQIAQPINYFWPTLLTILLAIFSRENIPPYKFIGMLISFGGVILISAGTEGFAGIQLSKTGIFLALSSAFVWAIFWIINRKNQKIDTTLGLFLNFLFGSCYLLTLGFFVPFNLISWQGFLSGVYTGLFELVIPFIFFGLALRKSNNLSFTNQLIYLSPFISLFIIHLVLGERIYSTTYSGLSLIVSGILVNEYLSRKKKRTIYQ